MHPWQAPFCSFVPITLAYIPIDYLLYHLATCSYVSYNSALGIYSSKEFIFAGDFATSGEQQVAQELEKLPDHWIIICNKTLVATNGRSFEIDLIVIGNQWVFLLDEKSWRGRIRGDDMQWVRQDGSAV